MFKLFVFAALLAFAFAAPQIYSPLAYSAYSSPLAYSTPYAYSGGYSGYTPYAAGYVGGAYPYGGVSYY